MTILASILPGVRELRAPIVAGFMWIAVFALTLEPRLYEIGRSQAAQRFRAIAGSFGPVAELATLSIVAFLIGSLSIAATERLSNVIQRRAEWIVLSEQTYEVIGSAERRLRIATNQFQSRSDKPAWSRLRALGRGFLLRFLPIRENGVSALYRRIEVFLSGHGIQSLPFVYHSMARHPSIGDARDYDPEETAAWLFTHAVFMDVFSGDLSTRLLMREELQLLYQEYDRHRAEFELRSATCFPALALTLAVVPQAGWSWRFDLLAAVSIVGFVFAVWMQGISRRAIAGDLLAIAVADGLISTPAIDRASKSESIGDDDGSAISAGEAGVRMDSSRVRKARD